jgi:Pro-kumamolisin, activation domain
VFCLLLLPPQKNGATSLDLVAHRDVLRVHMPLHRVEELFAARYTAYVAAHNPNRVVFRSAEHYQLPEELRAHVDLVLGISDFTPTAPARLAMRSGRHLLTEAEAEEVEKLEKLAAASVGLSVSGEGLSNGLIAVTIENAPVGVRGMVNVSMLYTADEEPLIFEYVQCPADTIGTHCTIRTELRLQNYRPVSVSAQFGSEAASYPYEVVVTPTVTPTMLRDLYKIPQGTRVSNAKVTQAVVEFEQQYYDPQSLSYFLESMGLDGDVDVELIGPNIPAKEGGEAALDIVCCLGCVLRFFLFHMFHVSFFLFSFFE